MHFAFATLMLALPSLDAQPFLKGDIASNFSLTDRRTGQSVSLGDYENHIIVLDFFAYWCAPCAFSSPDIEENIQRYYESKGGNANGVAVQVLAVNIENENTDLTDQFIEQAEMDLVVDDPSGVVWNMYNETDGIPLFAIINGVANSPSHTQWEVLHNAPSYPGSAFLQNIIDSVEAGLPTEKSFDSAIDLGNGWLWIDWFGSFNVNSGTWIFHEEHGWLYMGNGDLNTGQTFFDVTLGWLWTDRSRYPDIFSYERNSWIRYERGTASPRVFHDYRLDKNLEFINHQGSDLLANGFNLTNTTIPLNQIFRGAARDGIPAIDNPIFVSNSSANSFLIDSDVLLAVTSGSVTRGYPFRLLNWHEIVNDNIGEDTFVVTYCPLCGTGMVFDATVDGIERTFGVSGLLYLNNLLMYDRQSGSLWSQFALESVSNRMQKTRLQWRFSEQMTFANFKQKYPNGSILSTNTGFPIDYTVNPYDGYENAGPIFPGNGSFRDDLPVMEWVWGITVGDVAKAYPLARLPNGAPITDTVNGVSLRLTRNAQARSVSTIIISTGEALNNGVGSFWFSWQDFYPDTLVYEP